MKYLYMLSMVVAGLVAGVWADGTAQAKQAKADELRFVLYYPQVPPYMYQDAKTQRVVGVVPELLQDYFAQQQIKVNFVADNRTRAEHRLYQGDVDAMLVAKEWTQQPQRLVFSEPLLEHQDYLFSLQPTAAQGELVDWVKGKSVCTRQYYVYQALAPLFDSHNAVRVDSSDEEAQMKMLLNGRCDFAYMNDNVANWLLKNRFPERHVYHSATGFGGVGLTIAFTPRWAPYLKSFNQYLQQQKRDGSIEQWLKFYITKP